MNDSKRTQNSRIKFLCDGLRDKYKIDPSFYDNGEVKRGLRNADGTGVVAGVTKVGDVYGYDAAGDTPKPIDGKLYYRGIDIMDIVGGYDGRFGFEKVAYLLLFGAMPGDTQLQSFRRVLSDAGKMPRGFFEDNILNVPSKNILNQLQKCILALYSYDDLADEISPENVMRQSIELIGSFPYIVANSYAVKRHVYDRQSLYINLPDEKLSIAENFLHMIRRNNEYSEDEARLLDIMLILHAEHGGGNNSTFTCRVLSSAGTDTYSALSAAVGALKGKYHGGANEKACEMVEYIKSAVSDYSDGSVRDCLREILSGEVYDGAGKIYGLGHAVYTISDPRALAIKSYAREMAEKKGRSAEFELLEKVERIGIELLSEKSGGKARVCANIDLYSGLIYSMLDIPSELFTPIFAMARSAGWCAHRMEEILTGGKIIRPAYNSASGTK